jgi:integrase
MKTQRSRKQDWPRKITLGRVSVSIYKRTAPNGSPCFMVANYSGNKRRFDSYADEALAIESAGKLARQLSEREVLAAAMTNEQASEYAAAVQKLAPFKVALLSAADSVAECLKLVGDLPNLHAAAKFYRQRHKQTTAKRVGDVVAELLAVKEARGASGRYLQDLRSRLNRFAESFQKNAGDVTTAEISAWFDAQKKLAPQTHSNFRRVIHLLFKFAVARGFAMDNPVDGVDRVKVRNGEIEIFSPSEIARLLAAASPDFLPCLAIGAFAGLRSAEIERLEWSDVDLASRHIVVSAGNAKTASRRIVPVAENLAEWLKPYAGRKGKVWTGTHDDFYDAQQDTAKAAGFKWKANALRHSCASYMFALSSDAGRVAGFLGNSAAVIHRHYRELVKPADAQKFFGVKPEAPANVLPMSAAKTVNA